MSAGMMDGTTFTILFFVIVFVAAVAGYVYYVNMKMEEAGMGQKSAKKKIRKKDKASWSLGD
ncbi:unnamed protein product [Symbiodinium sp. CCMP2592]|nr:unnamed protein product [Symbiodinium sp. CCMP2592]